MERVATTTPRRELAGIEHRVRHLRRAIREEPHGTRATENAAALIQLQDLRDGWRGEIERNRAVWIEYHRRQFRVHQELARRHYVAWIRLQCPDPTGVSGAEPRSDQGVIACDEPSTNGHAH